MLSYQKRAFVQTLIDDLDANRMDGAKAPCCRGTKLKEALTFWPMPYHEKTRE